MLLFEGTREEAIPDLSPNLWYFLGLWQCISNIYTVFSLCVCLYIKIFYSIRISVMLD